MTGELITLWLLLGCCFSVSYYTALYLGWVEPQYHQADKRRAIAWTIIAVGLLAALVVEMAVS